MEKINIEEVKTKLKQRTMAETVKNTGVNTKSGTTPNDEQNKTDKDKKIGHVQAIQESMPPRYPDLMPNFAYYEDIKEGNSFLFTGGVGTGKTRKLLEILFAYFYEKAEPFMDFDSEPKRIPKDNINKAFLTVADVLRQIKNEFNENTKGGGIVERMMQTQVLFLDDLGAEKATDWVKEQLYIVINERYNWKRPIVVTTNLTMKEIADCYGDRFASRLVEMCVIEKFTGKDWRLSK